MNQRVKPQRQIDELIWVRRLDEVKAPWKTDRKLSNAQKKGLAYERKVRKLIDELIPDAQVLYGVWFQFKDKNGTGIAQPDYVVKQRSSVIIFEVKLTHTKQAELQLKGLYGPLVSTYFKLPPVLVEVCKNLTPDKNIFLVPNLSEARANGRIHTIHWRP